MNPTQGAVYIVYYKHAYGDPAQIIAVEVTEEAARARIDEAKRLEEYEDEMPDVGVRRVPLMTNLIGTGPLPELD